MINNGVVVLADKPDAVLYTACREAHILEGVLWQR